MVGQRALLEVIYEVFLLDVPVETTDFTEALNSVGGYRQNSFHHAFVVGSFDVTSDSQNIEVLLMWNTSHRPWWTPGGLEAHRGLHRL